MEEILDQQFNENEKDETRINRIAIVFRIILCVYLLISIYKIAFGAYSGILETFQESTEDGLIMLTFVLFVLGIIVYNIRHIQLEIKYKFVIPYFGRGFIATFIASIFSFLVVNITALYDDVVDGNSYSELITTALFVLSLLIIFYREIIYFARTTRLKRLKNE